MEGIQAQKEYIKLLEEKLQEMQEEFDQAKKTIQDYEEEVWSLKEEKKYLNKEIERLTSISGQMEIRGETLVIHFPNAKEIEKILLKDIKTEDSRFFYPQGNKKRTSTTVKFLISEEN